MKKPKFQAPTGMHDILPQDQKYFQKIYNTCENLADFYGFRKIDTPILEETELFIKGTGDSTDIIQKQMYNLKTKGGDYLTLRPEFTPGVIRAFIEHGMQNLPQPIKLYSLGPLFRFERPQAGRFRQFHQFNLEIIGEKNPVVDSQIIQIFYNVLSELKFKNLIVKINSIGDSQCRPYYKKLLVSYYKSRESALCADCQRRLKTNPLRILDCKEEKCQRIVGQAPQMIDHLCEECHHYFKSVLEFLDEIGLPYSLDPYLVRGLDYYTKTVFEIFTEDSQKAEENVRIGTIRNSNVRIGTIRNSNVRIGTIRNFKESFTRNALAGGGRYDGLVKLFGGEDTNAVGGAMGVERIILAMKNRGVKLPEPPSPPVFLAQIGNLAKRKSLKLLEDFRKAKIQTAEAFGRDSLSAQLNTANKIGAKYTLLLGQKEVLGEMIIIKDMESGQQETVKMEKIINIIKKKLKK